VINFNMSRWREHLASDALGVLTHVLPFLSPGDPKAQQFTTDMKAIQDPTQSDGTISYLMERLSTGGLYRDYIEPLTARYRRHLLISDSEPMIGRFDATTD